MIKTALFVTGLLISGLGLAQEFPTNVITHTVSITGVPQGEGRYLRADIIENNQFKSGYYFCATNRAYSDEISFNISNLPYERVNFIKFSICQDESLTQCQEVATDQYRTFRNDKGALENDVSQTSFDISNVKDAFKACDPDLSIINDDLVTQSIHESDRRFAHVG